MPVAEPLLPDEPSDEPDTVVVGVVEALLGGPGPSASAAYADRIAAAERSRGAS